MNSNVQVSYGQSLFSEMDKFVPTRALSSSHAPHTLDKYHALVVFVAFLGNPEVELDSAQVGKLNQLGKLSNKAWTGFLCLCLRGKPDLGN